MKTALYRKGMGQGPHTVSLSLPRAFSDACGHPAQLRGGLLQTRRSQWSIYPSPASPPEHRRPAPSTLLPQQQPWEGSPSRRLVPAAVMAAHTPTHPCPTPAPSPCSILPSTAAGSFTRGQLHREQHQHVCIHNEQRDQGWSWSSPGLTPSWKSSRFPL